MSVCDNKLSGDAVVPNNNNNSSNIINSSTTTATTAANTITQPATPPTPAPAPAQTPTPQATAAPAAPTIASPTNAGGNNINNTNNVAINANNANSNSTTNLNQINQINQMNQSNGDVPNQMRAQQANNLHGIATYMYQLVKDRKQLATFPLVFKHVERLLDEEIARVHISLFQMADNDKRQMPKLPEPEGPVLMLDEKVFIPVDKYPDFNFVGRILGPRGMTARQLEQETGCKIMIRGRGSMRDAKFEEISRSKTKHLSENLHVLISVKDTMNRAKLRLAHAVHEIEKLLVPHPLGQDELKKRQLLELAILNGTYKVPAKTISSMGFKPFLPTPNAAAAAAAAAAATSPPNSPFMLPVNMSSNLLSANNNAAAVAAATSAAFDNSAAAQMLFASYGEFTNFAVLNGS